MVAPSMVTPKIPVALIDRNPRQPRKIFDPDELAELTASIKEHGVLQPIRVQPAGERFLLIAGERRLIAARLANLTEIPAVIGPVAEGREILIQAIAENVQRADMNPVDEAKAYQVLQDEFEMNVNQIAREVGKSRAYIDNLLLLVKLEEQIQQFVTRKQLSKDPRLARALLSISNAGARLSLVNRLVRHQTPLKSCIKAALKLASQYTDTHLTSPTPALVLAKHKLGVYEHAEDAIPPRWDAMRESGKVPPWETVLEAVKGTCGECSLRDLASSETCGACPGTVMLQKMMVSTYDNG